MEPGEYEREGRAGLGFDRAAEDELKDRHTVKINRKLLHPPRKQVEVEAEVGGFERAHETVLSERKILKIRRKTEEEEKIESAAEFSVAKVAAKEAETAEDMRAKKERRRVSQIIVSQIIYFVLINYCHMLSDVTLE